MESKHVNYYMISLQIYSLRSHRKEGQNGKVPDQMVLEAEMGTRSPYECNTRNGFLQKKKALSPAIPRK